MQIERNSDSVKDQAEQNRSDIGSFLSHNVFMIFNCDGVSFLYFINYQLLEFILYEYIYIFNNYFELKKINVLN